MKLQTNKSKRVEYENLALSFYFYEACGVFVFSVFLFLALSLISYCPHDNTMFHYESDLFFIKNWAGAVGAQISDFLFYLMGSGAYALLAVLAVTAYMFLFGYRQRPWLGMLLLPGAVLAATVLAAIYDVSIVYGLPGGIIGYKMAHCLTRVVGFYGAAIIAWATFWVSCVVALRISFIRAFARLFSGVAFSRGTLFF